MVVTAVPPLWLLPSTHLTVMLVNAPKAIKPDAVSVDESVTAAVPDRGRPAPAVERPAKNAARRT
ncbi:hypothetical protein [Nocardia beijingensis]